METMISQETPNGGPGQNAEILIQSKSISVYGDMCPNFAFLASTPDDYNVKSYLRNQLCNVTIFLQTEYEK